jgi:hypothetical protein
MGIVQEDTELIEETAAKKVGRGCHLLLHDLIVFLFLCGRLEPLPWKGATKEDYPVLDIRSSSRAGDGEVLEHTLVHFDDIQRKDGDVPGLTWHTLQVRNSSLTFSVVASPESVVASRRPPLKQSTFPGLRSTWWGWQ